MTVSRIHPLLLSTARRPNGAALLGAFALASLAPLGCGGSAPPPQAPAGSASSGPVVVTPPPPVELGPVPDPKGLVATGRIAKLSASFDVVHGWSKLPMPGADQVTELLTSEAVGGLVDLDQPIDFAVALAGKLPALKDSGVLAAVSAAVKDPDKAKASLSEHYKLVTGANGVVQIQGLGRPSKSDADDDEDDKGDKKSAGDPERICELSPAFGPAPTRLVCAWSSKALAELGPWLTRTATRSPSTSDAHVELRLEPLKEGIDLASSLVNGMASDLLPGNNQYPGAKESFSAILGDVGSFARDVSTLAIDLQLNDPGATLSTTLKLGGTTSEIGRYMTGHPERNGPPPAVFWELPGDADQALFARGSDDADAKKAVALVQPLLQAVLGEAGLKEADRKALLDPWAKAASGAPWVYASGLDAEAVRRALAALVPFAGHSGDPGAQEARHAAAQALIGWHLVESEAPPAQQMAVVKDMVAAWSRPSVVAALRAKHADLHLPTVRTAAMPKSVALPAGGVHYIVEVPVGEDAAWRGGAVAGDKAKPGAKRGAKPRPLVLHAFFLPDGQRTWFGLCGDETTCAARLATSLASSGNKLGSRADLAALKQSQNLGSAGFFTLRGFGEGLAAGAVVADESPSEVVSAYESSLQLPHQALTPIPFSFTSQPGHPGSLVSSFTLSKGAIEDIVMTLVKHGGF